MHDGIFQKINHLAKNGKYEKFYFELISQHLKHT